MPLEENKLIRAASLMQSTVFCLNEGVSAMNGPEKQSEVIASGTAGVEYNVVGILILL